MSAVRCVANPQAIIDLPVTELADRIDASEASIVFFCKRLGFKGFHDFKIALSQNIYDSSSDIHEEIDRNDETPVIIKKVFHTSIQGSEGYTHAPGQRGAGLDRAADLLQNTKRVMVFGTGVSGIIAKDLWMKL